MVGISGHGYEILIAATFPKDMPQEKARKIMKDRVSKWKAEKEGLQKGEYDEDM